MRRLDVVMIGHGKKSFAGSAAPIAAFMAITYGGRNGPEPEAKRRAEAQRRMAEAGYFASRCKGPQGRRKIAGRSHCRPGPLAVRSPSRRPCARPSPAAWTFSRLICRHRKCWRSYDGSRREEADNVLRYELNADGCSEGVETEDVQIFVKVTQPGR